MIRERLDNRRPNRTISLEYGGETYHVTIGFYFDPTTVTLRVAEVFTHGAKVGSEMDGLLDDACIALSLLLQYGAKPKQIAASMGRDGDKPASIIGALADLLVEWDKC